MENKNLNSKLFDFIEDESTPTIADQKINDSMIILSKKIDEIIELNKKNHQKINEKASFIRNKYLWEIEDLEAKLNKKIEKANVILKVALKKIDPTEIKANLDFQKNADIDFIKQKNKILIERLEKNENDILIQNKIKNILVNEQNDVNKISSYYENLVKNEIRNGDQKAVKDINSNHDTKIKYLKSEFELKKKEILKLHELTLKQRENQANILEKSFKVMHLTTENLTSTQAKEFRNYLNLKNILGAKKAQLNNLIENLKKNKSKALLKQIRVLEKEIFKIENTKINKTTTIDLKNLNSISKSRLQAINQGILKNTNIVSPFVRQEMLPDLIPSYHSYKINPLIKPNNTYFAHKYHGIYKAVRFGSALIGIAIGIILMVLYTLFSIQSAQVWINSGAEKITELNLQNIFIQNMNLGFTELFNLWNLPAAHWTALLSIGIILLLTSSLTAAMRNHTVWSYASIASQVIFLIIGTALMIDTFVKMDFGVVFKDGDKTILIMTEFRKLVGLVQENKQTEAISSFEKLISSLGGTIPSWK